MQKLKIFLLLPALFISSHLISMDQPGSDLLPHRPEPSQPWHWTRADVFIIPNSPEPERKKKPIVPPINLKTREEMLVLKEQEDRREKIKEAFGKNFVEQSKKEEHIGDAIQQLKNFDPTIQTPASITTSLRNRSGRSPDQTSNRDSSEGYSESSESGQEEPDNKKKQGLEAPNSKREKRVLSHETPLIRSSSKSLIIAAKTPEKHLSEEQSSTTPPPISPRNDSSEISPTTSSGEQTPPPTSAEKIVPQISIISITPHVTSPQKTPTTTPLVSPRNDASEITPPDVQTPSQRGSNTEISADTPKTPEKRANTSEKQEVQKIKDQPQETNPTSMRPLTWQDGKVALLTITGLLALLYYFDKLPVTITAQIDRILATLKMNR